jgi:hypothetical protein
LSFSGFEVSRNYVLGFSGILVLLNLGFEFSRNLDFRVLRFLGFKKSSFFKFSYFRLSRF